MTILGDDESGQLVTSELESMLKHGVEDIDQYEDSVRFWNRFGGSWSPGRHELEFTRHGDLNVNVAETPMATEVEAGGDENGVDSDAMELDVPAEDNALLVIEDVSDDETTIINVGGGTVDLVQCAIVLSNLNDENGFDYEDISD